MSWMSPLTVPMTTLPIGLRAGLGQQRPQDGHAGLHRVGGEEDLGHEQDPVAEVDADDPHALDERLVEHAVRAPAAAEQDVRALDDLVGQAVVEVVVHLLDELVVGQAREVELLVVGHAGPPAASRGSSAARRDRRPGRPGWWFHNAEPCRIWNASAAA